MTTESESDAFDTPTEAEHTNIGSEATSWIGDPQTPNPVVPAEHTFMEVEEQGFAAQALSPGEMIAGRYQLKELLGRGGFGSVYRAENTDLGHDVAIKLLNPEVAASNAAKQRFLREVKSQTSLVHKYAVPLRDCGRDKERRCLYFTMDLAQGPTLREVLNREGPLVPTRAVMLVCQALETLAEANRLGLVHRDIKPSNLVVTFGPGGEEIRILDFGIAKAVSEAKGVDSGMTRTGAALGTLRYMSPEQADGRKLDHRSDLYSLGVVLFECLSRARPTEPSPDAENMTQSFLANLMTKPARDLSELAPTIPTSLRKVVMKALEKRPDDRYADADAFRAALEALKDELARLKDQPAPAEPRAVAKKQANDGARTPTPAPAPPAQPAMDEATKRKLWLGGLVALLTLVIGFQVWRSTREEPQASKERVVAVNDQPLRFNDLVTAIKELQASERKGSLIITETSTRRSLRFTAGGEAPLELKLTKLSKEELTKVKAGYMKNHLEVITKPGAENATVMLRFPDADHAAKAAVTIIKDIYGAPDGARIKLQSK